MGPPTHLGIETYQSIAPSLDLVSHRLFRHPFAFIGEPYIQHPNLRMSALIAIGVGLFLVLLNPLIRSPANLQLEASLKNTTDGYLRLHLRKPEHVKAASNHLS